MRARGPQVNLGAKHQGQWPRDPSVRELWLGARRRLQAAPRGTGWGPVAGPGWRSRGVGVPPPGAGSGIRRRAGGGAGVGRGGRAGGGRFLGPRVQRAARSGPSVRPQALPESTSEWPPAEGGRGPCRGRVRATPSREACAPRLAGRGRGGPGLRACEPQACERTRPPTLEGSGAPSTVLRQPGIQCPLPDTGNRGCRGRGP